MLFCSAAVDNPLAVRKCTAADESLVGLTRPGRKMAATTVLSDGGPRGILCMQERGPMRGSAALKVDCGPFRSRVPQLTSGV